MPDADSGFSIKATNIGSWRQNGFSDIAFIDSTLLRLTKEGFNHVFLDFQYAFDKYGNYVVDSPFNTPLNSIQAVIDSAKRYGLNVSLRPHTTLYDPMGSNANEGNIQEWNIPISFNKDNFFKDYKKILIDLADLSQKNNLNLFSLGVEMNAFDTSKYNAYWYDIISSVRNTFNGKLTYGAGSWLQSNTSDINSVTFFDKLDYVGIDLYPYLGKPNISNGYKNIYDSISSAITRTGTTIDYIQWMKELGKKFNKQVLIEEFGFNSITGSANSGFIDVWKLKTFPQPDYNEQVNATNALIDKLRSSNNDNWLAGFSIWGIAPSLGRAWDSENRENTRYLIDNSYLGKPVEAAIASQLRGQYHLLDFTQKNLSGSLNNDNLFLQFPTLNTFENIKDLDATIQTHVRISLDSAIINGETYTVQVLLNGDKKVPFAVPAIFSGYVSPIGTKYSDVYNLDYYLDGIKNIESLSISIISPLLKSDGVIGDLFIQDVSVNGIKIKSANYKSINGSMSVQSSPNIGLWNGGSIDFNVSSYNDFIKNRIGALANPFFIDGDAGYDTLNLAGRLLDFRIINEKQGKWTVQESAGLNQNALITNIEKILFSDGSYVSLPSFIKNIINSTITLDGKRGDYYYNISENMILKLSTSADTINQTEYFKIKRLSFADGTIALDINGNAGQAYRLYQAALDRKPDERGLAGWIKFMDEGGSLTAMSQQFIDSQEFRTKYGALDNSKFVNQLYLNVLDRNGEPAGIAGWVNGLANGLSRAEVLKGFSESSENQANVIGQIKNGIPYVEWWLA